MKISLSWILDHIKVNRKEIDVPSLVAQLNATTSEIDGLKHVQTDIAKLFIARLVNMGESYEVDCLELRKKITVPVRKDGAVHHVYLIKKEENVYKWATLIDLGSDKDGLVPAVWVDEKDIKGNWRTCFEQEDHIIIIDNKALTNRPDLWSHRGFAREVAALLRKELQPEDRFLESKPIKHYDHEAPATASNPFIFEIKKDVACQVCRRLAGIYVSQVEYRPSLLYMATRLARVDARPIDALVDMTNYVMFDIGQPMHAFDATRIHSKKLVGCCAYQGEKVKLLDGDEVTLTASDYVISDGEHALSVAGVMGGAETAVDKNTSSLLLEAASFDPTAIRRTATRLKKRSESSTRFEKNLDPNQNTTAVLRYLKLLSDAQIEHIAADYVVSLGPLAHEKKIEVTHALIESKIGMAVSSEKVIEILTRLGFGVEYKKEGLYNVTVPTYRATKDITITEDLVEEVARFVGYNSIIPHPPVRAMAPFDIRSLERKRALKKMLAYGLHMREVQTYAFFDEEFLRVLQYDPQDALRIANPLSEHWQRLVTSLVPNLLKCIATNQGESLRFFESNRVWFMEEKPTEEQECSGIWYEQKELIDFYEGKALLEEIFDLLKLKIRWAKPTKGLDPWYDPYQSAELWHKDRIIGRAGKAAPLFLKNVGDGDAFIFELDANFLLNSDPEKIVFKPLSKYPITDLDISMLVPLECTVAGIEEVICTADERITSVELIDSFEKPDWPDKKSLTFRFTAYDEAATLTKDAIDQIWNHVVQRVTAIGAQVR